MTTSPLAARARPARPGAAVAPPSAEERLALREAVLHQRRMRRLQLAHPSADHRAGGHARR